MRAAIALSVAIYRVLLLRYPRRLRVRFGEDMVGAFRALLEEETRLRGLPGVAGAWSRVLREWVRPLPVGPQARGPGASRRGWVMADGMRRMRVLVRSLLRSPGFTIPALLILAVGMTAATAIYSVVDTILFRPLPFPEADRLVVLCEDHPRLSGLCIASPGNTEDLRQGTTTLAELGIGRGWPFALGNDTGSQGVSGGLATPGFLRALGATPFLGRLPADDEFGPGRDKVVVLSHDFWTTRFGGDSTVVGSVIRLDGEPYEVVGVLEPGFEAPLGMEGIELWKPPHFDPLDPEVRGWRGFRAVGRLAAGATLASAGTELFAIYGGIAERSEEVDDSWRLRVEPLLRVVVGDTRPVLIAILGAAGLLLLIVCANVANLVLARGMDRSRELAVRSALGADRRRLAGDIILEGLVVTGAATVLAMVFGGLVTRLLVSLAPPDIPRLDGVAVDGRVLGVMALVSVAATLVFALIPALRVTAGNLAGTIKSGGRAGGPKGASRLRTSLVVAEVALSVVLVSTAGVLTRSFAAYLDWQPGFERVPLLSLSAFLDVSKHEGPVAWADLYRAAEDRVGALPGVLSVSTASAGPLFGGGDGATPFTTPFVDEQEALPVAFWYDLGPAHFETLGLAVLAGREFTEADDRTGPRVAIVNEALARAGWPDGTSPVGRTVRLPELDLEFDVVGVVANVAPMTPGDRARPEIYWSNRQLPRPATFFLIRADGDPSALSRSVSRVLQEVDPDLSLGAPRTLASIEAGQLVRPRFQALVLIGLGVAALALSWVGVYAVVSYAVARRIREMGIRMALGAGAGNVLRLVLGWSLATTLAGVALGMVGSVLAAGLLQGVVQGVPTADPLSMMVAGTLLLAAAGFAAVIPARRATRVDPLSAMRKD